MGVASTADTADDVVAVTIRCPPRGSELSAPRTCGSSQANATGMAAQSRTCRPAVASTATASGSAPSNTADRSQTTPRGPSAKASWMATSRSSITSLSRPATSRTTTSCTTCAPTSDLEPARTWRDLRCGCAMAHSIRLSLQTGRQPPRFRSSTGTSPRGQGSRGARQFKQYTQNRQNVEPEIRLFRRSDLEPHSNDCLSDGTDAGVVAARVSAHQMEGLIHRDRVLLGCDPLGLFDDDPGLQSLLQLLAELLLLAHLRRVDHIAGRYVGQHRRHRKVLLRPRARRGRVQVERADDLVAESHRDPGDARYAQPGGRGRELWPPGGFHAHIGHPNHLTSVVRVLAGAGLLLLLNALQLP